MNQNSQPEVPKLVEVYPYADDRASGFRVKSIVRRPTAPLLYYEILGKNPGLLLTYLEILILVTSGCRKSKCRCGATLYHAPNSKTKTVLCKSCMEDIRIKAIHRKRVQARMMVKTTIVHAHSHGTPKRRDYALLDIVFGKSESELGST